MTGGIVVTDGATFRISSISITIDEATRAVTAEGGEPSIHYDVCPVWLSIAIKHLEEAKQARADMSLVKDDPVSEQKFLALEREFRSSVSVVLRPRL